MHECPPSSTWPTRRILLICAVLVVASAGIRAVCFIQLRDNPALVQHLWDQSDMNFFDLWARDIAAGDWLTNRPLHPLHNWHKEVAEWYVGTFHGPIPPPSPDEPSASPAKRLWDHWYGGKRFHQEPLYPYLVALTYKASGPDVRWVFLWQFALGVATNLLLYLLARRWLGEWPALLVAILSLLYAPLLYYEILLLREALLVFATVALMYLATIANARNTPSAWLICGVGIGLALLIKTTLILFAVAVILAIILRNRRLRPLLARAGAFVLGILIALSPAIARNLAVGVGPFDFASVGTVTFVNANTVENPQFGFFWSLRFAPRIMGESQGRLFPAARLAVATYETPARYLASLWPRLKWTFNRHEIPNNSNFYYYRLHTPILRWLPVDFAFLAAPAIVGFFLALRRWRTLWPLYAMFLANILLILAFYTGSRMRLPLVPEAILLTALFVAEVVRWIRQRNWPPAAMSSAAMLWLLAWSLAPIPPLRPVIRYEDYSVPYLNFYVAEAGRATRSGDLPRALHIMQRFLADEPAHFAKLDAWHTVRDTIEQKTAELFAEAHLRYSWLLDEAHRPADAQRHRQRARDLMAAAGKDLPV